MEAAAKRILAAAIGKAEMVANVLTTMEALVADEVVLVVVMVVLVAGEAALAEDVAAKVA